MIGTDNYFKNKAKLKYEEIIFNTRLTENEAEKNNRTIDMFFTKANKSIISEKKIIKESINKLLAYVDKKNRKLNNLTNHKRKWQKIKYFVIFYSRLVIILKDRRRYGLGNKINSKIINLSDNEIRWLKGFNTEKKSIFDNSNKQIYFLCWSIFIIFIVLFYLFYINILLSFGNNEINNNIYTAFYCIDIVMFIDAIISLVSYSYKINLHFIINILSFIPISNNYNKYYLFFKLISVFKFFYILNYDYSIAINKIKSNWIKYFFIGEYFKIFKFVFIIYMFVHIFSCMYFFISKLKNGWINSIIESNSSYNYLYNNNQISLYFIPFYWAITTISTVGYGDITPTNSILLEVIYNLLFLFIGVSIYSTILSTISSYLNNADDTELSKKYYFLEDIGKSNLLSKPLLNKITDNIKNNFNSDNNNLSTILNDFYIYLPNKTQNTIMNILFYNLNNNIFFKNVNNIFKSKVLLKVVKLKLKAGDNIYKINNYPTGGKLTSIFNKQWKCCIGM